MTETQPREAAPFLETAAVGGLMLAMAAVPLATARFPQDPYFLLTLKWAVAAILVLPAAAVRVLGAPTLRRAREGDGVAAAWLGLGVLAAAGADAFAPAVTRLVEMLTVAAAYFIASRGDRALVRSAFTGVLLPAAAVIALYSLAQHLGWNPLGLVAEGDDQRCATFVNRNLLAGLLAFALPIGIEVAASEAHPGPRAAAALALALIVAALWESQTRGAWIGAGLAVLLWTVARARRAHRIALAGIGLGALLAFVVMAQEVASGPPPGAPRSRSVRERWMLGRIALDLVRDRPLLGWGPGNFDLASEGYKARYFREEANRATRELPRFAHDDALELSTEMGVPGALLWLCLVGAIARRGWRAARSDDAGGVAIALSCAAVAVHGLFHFSLHDPVVSLLFFAGLGAIAPASPPGEPLRPAVARLVKVAAALVAAVSLLHLSRVLAARALFERAASDRDAGQAHEALWALRRASELDPAFAPALAQRATVLAEMGYSLDALRLLEEARAQDPHDEALLLNMALLHERRGCLAAARWCLERAIEGNPNLEPAYCALARVVEAEGHAGRAKELRAEADHLRKASREER